MFSEREEEILKVLGRRRMTLRVIADELFDDEYERPMEPEITVGNTIRRIIKKCEHHQLKWTLVRKKSNGRLTIWRISL